MPLTGQQVVYYYNAKTGESQYTAPAEGFRAMEGPPPLAAPDDAGAAFTLPGAVIPEAAALRPPEADGLAEATTAAGLNKSNN